VPAAAQVFVSHSGIHHPLAIALRALLRQAGFEPFVYNPWLSRPPAQMAAWGSDRLVWADLDTAGDQVNISHLREPLESSACLLLLDDASRVDQIESWHVRAEVLYAWWQSHWGPGEPSVVALQPALARALVLSGDTAHVRDALTSLMQQAKPWFTYPRVRNAALAVLVVSSVAAIAQPWPAAAPCGTAAVFMACTLLFAHGFRGWFSRFVRAAYLGEVNSTSQLVIFLFGLRTRPMSEGETEKSLMNEVHRELAMHYGVGVRRVALRAIQALPHVLLLRVMPAAMLLGVAAVAWELLR
jgi:hypothetical protein